MQGAVSQRHINKNSEHVAPCKTKLIHSSFWEENILCSLHKWPLTEKQWNYTDAL